MGEVPSPFGGHKETTDCFLWFVSLVSLWKRTTEKEYIGDCSHRGWQQQPDYLLKEIFLGELV